MPHAAHQAAAVRQAHLYTEQSHRYAEAGDGRRAVLAQWAADVAALHVLLWESGLGTAPDPAAQLATVAAALEERLSQVGPLAPAEDADGDAAGALGRARSALAAAFDPAVHALLQERFGATEHLVGLSTSPKDDTRDGRRAGRTPEQLAATLLVAAEDCLRVARAMDRAELPQDRTDQEQRALLAVLEAFLVTSASEVDDRALATVDVRWDLALTTLTPQDPELREALLSAVTPQEAEAVRSQLHRLEDAVR